MMRAIEGVPTAEALLWMAKQLLRRHRDQVLRARRGPRSEAANLLWKASRLLPLAGRLASDAARAAESTFRSVSVEAPTWASEPGMST